VSYLTKLFRNLSEDTEKNTTNLTCCNRHSGSDFHLLLCEHYINKACSQCT